MSLREITFTIDDANKDMPFHAQIDASIAHGRYTERLVGHKADEHTAQAVPPSELQEALEQRDRALAERDHARSLACSFEEKLALIRRRGAVRDHHV